MIESISVRTTLRRCACCEIRVNFTVIKCCFINIVARNRDVVNDIMTNKATGRLTVTQTEAECSHPGH